jgi:hypothetical protein
MKPNSIIQYTPERVARCEEGSLLIAKPLDRGVILICTTVCSSPRKISGVIIASPNKQDIGRGVEYLINGVEIFNGKVTLEQVW